MKVFLIISLLALLFHPCFAQKTVLATVEKDGKYGCINLKGEEVLPVIYDDLREWNEGMIAVNFGAKDSDNERIEIGKWGFCNLQGKLVIQMQYNDAKSFTEGLCAVRVDSLWGFIDHQGNMVIKPQFKEVLDFSEGLCGVQRFNENWGFIDKKGAWVLPAKYDWVRSFKKGFCLVSIRGKGIPGIYYAQRKWGIIDKTGKYFIKPRYSWIGDFHGGYAYVRLGGAPRLIIHKSGFINKQGKLTRLKNFNYTYDFHEGIALMHLNKKRKKDIFRDDEKEMYGYIDTTGKLLTRDKYGEAIEFEDGYAVVSFEKWPKYGRYYLDSNDSSAKNLLPVFGLIDKTGKKVLDFKFHELTKIELQGLYIAQLATGNEQGVISINEEIIMRYNYHNLSYLGGNYFSSETLDSELAVTFITGKTIFKTKEFHLQDPQYAHGLLQATQNGPDGKTGFVDLSGNWVIKPVYEETGQFYEVDN